MGSGPVLAVEASSLRPSVALLGPTGESWGRWDAPEGARGTATLAVAAQELLAGTEREVSVFAPLFDLQFKGRLDAVDFGACRIVDLKTTSDLGPNGKSFGYRFHDFHYGPQLWIYRELLWVITGEMFAVDLIVVVLAVVIEPGLNPLGEIFSGIG